MITIRKDCNSIDDCDDHSPPVPPPPENHNSISPFTLFLICTLAATFSFISYITIIKTCRSFQTRRRTRMMMMIRTHVMNTNSTNESHEPPNQDLIDDQSPVFHPIWLINTVGLDQSVIDSIKIFKYRKEDSTCDHLSDCAVCLGVFQEDESLRLLPDCSHAFHVTCIDTWLRSHKNCPLCRAPVADNSGIHRSTDDRILVDDEESETPFDVPENETVGVGNDEEIMDANGESSEKKSSVSGNLKRSVSMGSAGFLDQESGNLVVSSKTSVVPTRSVNRRGSSLSVSIYGRGSMGCSFRLSSDNIDVVKLEEI